MPVHVTDKPLLECDNIDKEIDAELFIFASKHSSAAGVPSLCVHVPGNWFDNAFGGKKQTLCTAPALYLAEALVFLEQQKPDCDVVQECTHHGPSLTKPVLFIEIGSSPAEYTIQRYGKIIAETIQHLIAHKPMERKVALGIGGTHYCHAFKKLVLEENYAFGHICPKYQLQNLTKEMLQQAIDKTIPEVEEIVIDWKGVSGYKDTVRHVVENVSISVRKI